MKVGDVVNVTEKRGAGEFYKEIPLGIGLILNIEKTDDIMMGMVGPINLGDSVTVQLSSGETKLFHNTSLEVIND